MYWPFLNRGPVTSPPPYRLISPVRLNEALAFPSTTVNCGYNSQSEGTDPFAVGSSLRIKEMLLFCDIYPIELPSRYTNKYACYNKVYIISNWSLEKQYYEVQKDDRESWEAFLRRIHKVVIYSKDGSIKEYDSVKAYLERDEFVEIDDDVDLPFD